MNRFLFLSLFLSVAVLGNAQSISPADSIILTHIQESNLKNQSIQTLFRHQRTRKGVTENCYGTLYYERVAPKKKGDVEATIAMHYSKPTGWYYIITTTALYNGLSNKHRTFNYKWVPLMKQLGNAMAWAVNGNVYSIFKTFNVSLSIATDKDFYTVTLTSRGGLNKGVDYLVLKYSRDDGILHYMEMQEKFGCNHKYTIGLDSTGKYHNPQFNISIPASVYVVNERT